MSGKEQRIGYSVRELRILMNRYVDAKRGKSDFADVSFAQGGILHFLLAHQDEAVYQRDIEKEFGLRRSTVTGLLQGLEKNGYVERVSVPEDGRLKQIIMTDRTIAYGKEIERMVRVDEEVFLRGFSRQEKEALFEALDHIKENIRKEEELL